MYFYKIKVIFQSHMSRPFNEVLNEHLSIIKYAFFDVENDVISGVLFHLI